MEQTPKQEVKIFSNACDNVVHFETKEQFMRFYAQNKEEIDKIKTRGLNIKYKIDGYRIGRQKDVITLFPLKETTPVDDDKKDSFIQLLEIMDSKIDALSMKIDKILDGQHPPQMTKSMNPRSLKKSFFE